MSLVSTYVRAKDGYFYRNPVIREKDWFICFDDDDPAELVIKKKSNLRPQDIFKKIGLKYSKLTKRGVQAERIFEKKDWKFEPAISYFFEPECRINPKFIKKNDGRVKSEKRIGQGVIYDFKF